ncbi:MAG: LON peptidase substrate-binding domain-containing protein [Bacteroidetes bacterium]|nr:LON peptidase substrate-binding domain-containing protein [Bacteroidota bacterium]
MTKFIPIFPLNSIIYPGQNLNLHIFEERYKQLINECAEQKKTFGIPSVDKAGLNEYGTEMEIVEITTTYPDGTMDIKTRGVGIFRIIEVLREVPDKLYSAAVVYDVTHLTMHAQMLNPTFVHLMAKLHAVLATDFDLKKKFKNPTSYDLIPYAALSEEDQYRLLASVSERGRQWFIIQHLLKLIPTLEEAERVRAKVQLNGHFRREIPPQF